MDNVYVLMLVALGLLAVMDLIVGVSNDAVNFLNSAIGSKVISMRNILIIASLGVFVGAVTSSGMMEVARKGIFVPEYFYFNEIMYIFMAVMITDIILLDTFNSFGMPTSTTVSIVFELLGAAVAMAFIKISANDSEGISAIWKYINHEKALLIIFGILLSVVVAFSVGAIVQWISRLIFSFEFEKKPDYVSALFGGFAISAITYFIIVKGLKGTPFYHDIKYLIEGKETQIISISFAVWTLLSLLLIKVFKANIFKIIVGIGTFSIALAFAGNDLVNFIGVPIAALNSYDAWSASGLPANEFSMGILGKKVPSNTMLLLLAGGVMVLTLWFSKKARTVIETGINLSSQNEAKEKFEPNIMSRFVVRLGVGINTLLTKVMPPKTVNWVSSRFELPTISMPLERTYDLPAFDLVRASVNLIVAAVLISIGTSFKLPLSTTYVTFMVAMGTSLADRAWGRESAVYRVAGVLNIIGGWFFTALAAFLGSALVLYLMHIGGVAVVGILLLLAFFLIARSYISYAKKEKENKLLSKKKRAELLTIGEVIEESSDHISKVVKQVNKLYTKVVKDLSNHDLDKLKKTNKHVQKLNKEVSILKDEVFDFIRSMHESSVEASRVYILILGHLQNISQSIRYISKSSYNHVNNNHKNLKKGQIDDLNIIDSHLEVLLTDIENIFKERAFYNINRVISEKQKLFDYVSESIDRQVNRIRGKEDSSKKNTILYFGILVETKDLISTIMNLLELYQQFDLQLKKTDTSDTVKTDE